MSDNSGSGVRMRAVVTVLLVVAGMAAAFALYFERAAATSERERTDLEDRYMEEKLLAAEFLEAEATALAGSDDDADARSTPWLEAALERNKINRGVIDPGDPVESTGGHKRVDTLVSFDNAPLESVVAFLRDVEAGRENLRLVDADLDRQGTADSWNVKLTYVAIIRAKSRM